MSAAALASHPGDLDLHLRSDPVACTGFSIAAAHATAGVATLTTAGGVRAGLDATLRALMLQQPQWLGMAGAYDPALDDALAVARVAFGAAVVSAFDLDPARLLLVEPALGILDPAVDANYAALLRDHGLLLLDTARSPTCTARSSST